MLLTTTEQVMGREYDILGLQPFRVKILAETLAQV